MISKSMIGWFLLSALSIACASPPVMSAAEKGAAFVGPLFKELGLLPDEMPDRVTATVEDPESLAKLGLEGVKAGDGVELIDTGGGKIKVRHIATDRILYIQLK